MSSSYTQGKKVEVIKIYEVLEDCGKVYKKDVKKDNQVDPLLVENRIVDISKENGLIIQKHLDIKESIVDYEVDVKNLSIY